MKTNRIEEGNIRSEENEMQEYHATNRDGKRAIKRVK